MIEKSGNIKFAWRKVPTTYKNKKMALILVEVTYYRLVVGAHAILTLQAMKRKVESFCEKHLINDRNNNIWPISCKNSLINLILLSRYYLWIAFLALFFVIATDYYKQLINDWIVNYSDDIMVFQVFI